MTLKSLVSGIWRQPEERQKVQLLMRLWLRELSASPPQSLADVMDLLSDRASARGLTPEILESLLKEFLYQNSEIVS